MDKQNLATFLQKYEGEGCRFVTASSISEGKKIKRSGFAVNIYKLILVAVGIFSMMVVGGCGVSEKVEAVEPVEVEPVKEEKEYMETRSVDANVRIIHKETFKVEEVYYDEAYQSWYVVGEGWALEGSEDSANRAKGESVKVEFYVVDGVEYITGWGIVDERGNYKID